ncbi:hypothetical protein KIL84_019063 [Mauremys mutica]|uniref:Uncharacterized protein n=1 Tax=Mauremys mutica TaxID=74926 RepID=A0A9D4BAV6_9SAUR|nr:hypothetical protein KIL84_019063 [Mauremys mutica]
MYLLPAPGAPCSCRVSSLVHPAVDQSEYGSGAKVMWGQMVAREPPSPTKYTMETTCVRGPECSQPRILRAGQVKPPAGNFHKKGCGYGQTWLWLIHDQTAGSPWPLQPEALQSVQDWCLLAPPTVTCSVRVPSRGSPQAVLPFISIGGGGVLSPKLDSVTYIFSQLATR